MPPRSSHSAGNHANGQTEWRPLTPEDVDSEEIIVGIDIGLTYSGTYPSTKHSDSGTAVKEELHSVTQHDFRVVVIRTFLLDIEMINFLSFRCRILPLQEGGNNSY
jgi:hypothetical protein